MSFGADGRAAAAVQRSRHGRWGDFGKKPSTKSSLAMRSDLLPLSADIAWWWSVYAAAAFVTILGTGSRLNDTRAGRKCTHNSLKVGKGAAAVSSDCLDFFNPPPGSQVDRVMDSSHTRPNCLKLPRVLGWVPGPTAEEMWIFKACCERPGVKPCFVINGQNRGTAI